MYFKSIRTKYTSFGIVKHTESQIIWKFQFFKPQIINFGGVGSKSYHNTPKNKEVTPKMLLLYSFLGYSIFRPKNRELCAFFLFFELFGVYGGRKLEGYPLNGPQFSCTPLIYARNIILKSVTALNPWVFNCKSECSTQFQ